MGFFRGHRGATFASSALMDPITKDFVADIHRFVKHEGVDLVAFEKGQRKDDVAHEYLANFDGDEGVLFVGKAQEKTSVFRTEKRTNPLTGRTYPWIVRATAIVNQCYFYCVVELLAGEEVPPLGSAESDVLSGVTFEGVSPPRAVVLAFVQSHASRWSGKPPASAVTENYSG